MNQQGPRKHKAHAATFAMLSEDGKLALCLAAPLSVALFGAVSECEFQIVNHRADATIRHTPQVIKTAFQQATSLVMSVLHTKFTTGYSWSVEFTSTRKSTLLYIINFKLAEETQWDPSKELTNMRSLKSASKESTAFGSLFRLAVHPIDLRSGCGVLGRALRMNGSFFHEEEFARLEAIRCGSLF